MKDDYEGVSGLVQEGTVRFSGEELVEMTIRFRHLGWWFYTGGRVWGDGSREDEKRASGD